MKRPQVGDVYLSGHINIDPPKPKLCICVHPAGLWFFLINTEKRRMYDCIPVFKENNPFLDHDSFISTNPPFTLKQNEWEKAKFLGRISETDIGNILNKVNKSRLLTPLQKCSIIDSISHWRIDSNLR